MPNSQCAPSMGKWEEAEEAKLWSRIVLWGAPDRIAIRRNHHTHKTNVRDYFDPILTSLRRIHIHVHRTGAAPRSFVPCSCLWNSVPRVEQERAASGAS